VSSSNYNLKGVKPREKGGIPTKKKKATEGERQVRRSKLPKGVGKRSFTIEAGIGGGMTIPRRMSWTRGRGDGGKKAGNSSGESAGRIISYFPSIAQGGKGRWDGLCKDIRRTLGHVGTEEKNSDT